MKKNLRVAVIIGMLVIAFVAVAFATTRDNKVNAGGDDVVTTTTTTEAPTTEMPTEASTTEATTTPVETTTTETATTTITEQETTTMPVEEETTTVVVEEETTTAPIETETTTEVPATTTAPVVEEETTTEAPTTAAPIETTTTAPVETTTAKVEPETTTEAVKPLESWQKSAVAPSNTTEIMFSNDKDKETLELLASKYEIPTGVYYILTDVCIDLANYSIETWGYDPYYNSAGFLYDLNGDIIWELNVVRNGYYGCASIYRMPSEISADGTQFFDEYIGMWFDVPSPEVDMDAWTDYYCDRDSNTTCINACERLGVEVGQYYEHYARGFLGHEDCLSWYVYRISDTEVTAFDKYSEMMAAYPDATWSGAMIDRDIRE